MPDTSSMLSVLLGPVEPGRGWQQPYYLADPAAAGNASRLIPGESWERVIGARAQLVTSATVANRYVDVAVYDGQAREIVAAPLGGPQAASLTYVYHGHIGNGAYPFQQGTYWYGGLPDLVIRSGWTVYVRIVNAQTGDQLSGVRLLTQRFASNATQDLAGYGPP